MLIESYSVECEDCGKLYEDAAESEGAARAVTKSRGWTYSFAHGDRCAQCSSRAGKETPVTLDDEYIELDANGKPKKCSVCGEELVDGHHLPDPPCLI